MFKKYATHAILLIALLIAAIPAFTEPAPFNHETDVRFKKVEIKKTMRATYDFNVNGGTIGAFNLRDQFGSPATIPAGADVTHAWLDIHTQLAPSGTTIALACGSATFLAATDETGVVASGIVDLLPAYNAAIASWLSVGTSNCTVQMTSAVHTITAGKAYVFIDYFVQP